MADNNPLYAAQLKAAQIVSIARVATILCPGTEPDEEGIYSVMDHAGITDRDIMAPDRFGPEDEHMALSFKYQLAHDPALCEKMLPYLADQLKLVRRTR